MLTEINGLHHITSIASDAQDNNDFFTRILGLRRIKKTVNFDRPNVYHLYYGDAAGTPGTVMTYFPFPGRSAGAPGTGEVGTTQFAIPDQSAPFWLQHLQSSGVDGVSSQGIFGQPAVTFKGPDGEDFALIETMSDDRTPWQSDLIGSDEAIRGFHGASFRLADVTESKELLAAMGYKEAERHNGTVRMHLPGGNGADVIDLEQLSNADRAAEGAGSVHHIAFSVDDRDAQLTVRQAMVDAGYNVTRVFDRNYFWAIYFRTPGGVLFEVATNEPGFGHDESNQDLGQALKLPARHEHLRDELENSLAPIQD